MGRARSSDGAPEPQITKAGESADPEHPQPEAAEVESARLLENGAREALGDRMDDERLRRLADEFVSTGGQGEVAAFLAWLADRDPALAHHAGAARDQQERPAGGAEIRDIRG
jgi:hypothetical protein